jgi:hypothetical protein
LPCPIKYQALHGDVGGPFIEPSSYRPVEIDICHKIGHKITIKCHRIKDKGILFINSIR